MTSDFEEDGMEVVRVVAEGDADLLRFVVGRPLPFFLKNGTVFSVEAIL